MLLRQISESDMIKIGRLFMSPAGKEVMGILDKQFYHSISFTPGDPDMTAFREGQRDMVQIIRTAIKAVEQMEEGE